MVKKTILPIAVVYTITLFIMSLLNLNDYSVHQPKNSDKLLHFIAYAILFFLWYKVKHLHKLKISLISLVILSISFGIVMEFLQSILTTYREFSVYDMLANTLGVLITYLLIKITIK